MQNQLLTIVLSLLATLITLSVHEFSHAYAAYKLGDDTPKFLGRLTLNPLKHLDPIGALCMVFFHFGWAKPVPINPRNFKDGKKGSAIVSLAGPLSNLILAFILAFVYLLTFALLRDVQFESSLMFNIAQNSLDFLYIFHIVNVGIAIFNLIPIPPLDGSHILAMLLPPKAYFVYIKNQKRLYFILLGWLLIGDIIAKAILSVPMFASNPVMTFVAGFLSLSNLLSYVFGFVSDAMLAFWELIPFLKY